MNNQDLHWLTRLACLPLPAPSSANLPASPDEAAYPTAFARFPSHNVARGSPSDDSRRLPAKLREKIASGRFRSFRGESLQASEEPQVLPPGQVLVDGGVLAGDSDELSDLVGMRGDVDPEDGGAAAVDRQQRGQHLERVGLPGPSGPRTPKISPVRTARSTPSTAAKVLKRFTSPVASTARSW